MELTLLPRAGVSLGDFPAIKAARQGRTRGAAVRIIWHDGPDRALMVQGLTLAETRGQWSLERVRPEPLDIWPPATGSRLIESAADPGLLGLTLPSPLVQAAAFEGRRTVTELSIDGEAVTMSLLRGTIRAVAAERPAARVTLSGPDGPVRGLAAALSESGLVSVPAQALAVEALNLADGVTHAWRRVGAPTISAEGFSVADAFRHILSHLSDVILGWSVSAGDVHAGTEPIHQIRVAVRRARSAVSVFRPVFDTPELARVSLGLKVLSQMLGPARDWDVFATETLPPALEAMPDRPELESLSRAVARRRAAARAALSAWLAGPAFGALMVDLACLTVVEPVVADDVPGLDEFAASVLRGRWKKLLKSGETLEDLDGPGLHEVRLKAKRLRYAAEFFLPLFPEKPAVRFLRRLALVQERLGVFNDTAVAEGLLRELAARPGFGSGLVLGFTSARGAGVRPKIERAWERVRKREPFWG